jgi:NADH-quinone oxidoreductase subunit L
MTAPLIVLSFFAAFVALGGEEGFLYRMILHSEPVGLADGFAASGAASVAHPSHHAIHAVHAEAGAYAPGAYALLVAFFGAVLAYLLYGARILDPADIKRQFAGLHHFLVEKWQFDNLYDAMWVRPVHVVASWFAAFDKRFIDGFLHGVVRSALDVSRWDRRFDEKVIDGMVNLVGETTFTIGRSIRHAQTGKLREYVMFIALGVIVLFAVLYAFYPA